MNSIFLIVGESGCGKDTIVNKLCEKHGFNSLVSYTTRPRRTEDPKDVLSHVFVSEEEFNKLENLVAYTEFNGYKYGATSAQVEEADVYIIDCAGVEYFKNNYKGNKKVEVIYISVPKVERFLRMKARGGNTREAVIQAIQRTKHDEKAFANVRRLANYIVDNSRDGEEGLAQSVQKIHAIMTGGAGYKHEDS